MADSSISRPCPALSRCVAVGGLGFGAVSFLVFSTVAFGERWLYASLGLSGSYVVWTLLFIGLSALLFNSLTITPWRGQRFCGLFAAAFVAYAAAWCAAYFVLRDARGEWLGSLFGTFAMAAVFALLFHKLGRLPLLATLLFVAHSIGYFLGSILHSNIGGPSGMLLWGISYGLFFGAGIGAFLHFLQCKE